MELGGIQRYDQGQLAETGDPVIPTFLISLITLHSLSLGGSRVSAIVLNS